MTFLISWIVALAMTTPNHQHLGLIPPPVQQQEARGSCKLFRGAIRLSSGQQNQAFLKTPPGARRIFGPAGAKTQARNPHTLTSALVAGMKNHDAVKVGSQGRSVGRGDSRVKTELAVEQPVCLGNAELPVSQPQMLFVPRFADVVRSQNSGAQQFVNSLSSTTQGQQQRNTKPGFARETMAKFSRKVPRWTASLMRRSRGNPSGKGSL